MFSFDVSELKWFLKGNYTISCDGAYSVADLKQIERLHMYWSATPNMVKWPRSPLTLISAILIDFLKSLWDKHTHPA